MHTMCRQLCITILYLTFFVGYITVAKSKPEDVKVPSDAQCRRQAVPSFLASWIRTDRDTCDSDDWRPPLSIKEPEMDPKHPVNQLLLSDKYDETFGLPNFVLFQEFNVIEAIPADFSDTFCLLLLASSNEHLCPNIKSDYSRHSMLANREILRLWLLGGGKPISWSTLIKVLHDVQLHTAAEALISNLQLLSNLKATNSTKSPIEDLNEADRQDCRSTNSELQSTKILDPPDTVLLQNLNIFKEISNEHEAATVGTYLLTDNNGSIWKRIRDDNNIMEDRNRALFEEWLRKPVTWSILIDILNKSRLQRLSEKIMQSVEQCALHIPSYYQFSYNSTFISYVKTIKESYMSQPVIKFSRVQKSLPNRNFLPLSLKDHKGASLNLTKILNGHQRRWIITGQPGSGKTSLMRYIAKEWSEGKILVSCQFLFLIHLRACEGKYQSLSELLNVSYKDYDGIVQIAAETNGSATCLLLDGYDEKKVKEDIVYEMLNENKLPHSIRILTSRTGYIENYDNEIGHAEIIGFDMNSLDNYLYNLTDTNSTTIEKVHRIWRDQNVKEMCQLPLHMVMVIYIAAETKDISIQTKTDLYRSFLFATTDHFEPLNDDKDWNTSTLRWCIMGEDTHHNNQKLCKSFKMLLKIAHDMLKLKKTTFPSSSSLKNDINILGFTDMIDVNVHFAKEVQYVFAHRTFQEFFAALHLITLPQEQQLVQLLKEEHHNVIDQVMSNIFSGFHPFMHFYFGLLGYFYKDKAMVAISRPFRTIVAQRTYQYTCPNGQQLIQSFSVLDLHREIGLKGKKNAQLLQSAGIVLNQSVCLDISQMSSFLSMEYLVNYSAIHQIHVCDKQHIRQNYVKAMTIEDWNNPLNVSHLDLLTYVMTFNESDKRYRECGPTNRRTYTSISLITSKISDVNMKEKNTCSQPHTLASQGTNILTSADRQIYRLLLFLSKMGIISHSVLDDKTGGLNSICKIIPEMLNAICGKNQLQQESNCELLSLIPTLCQPRNMLRKEMLSDAKDQLHQKDNPISELLDEMISLSQIADDSNKVYEINDKLKNKTGDLIDMVEENFVMPLDKVMNAALIPADSGEGFSSMLKNLMTCLSNLTSIKLDITRNYCEEIVNSPKIVTMLSALPITSVNIECCEEYLNIVLTAFPSATDLSVDLLPCHHGASNNLHLAGKLPRLRNLFVVHPTRGFIQQISELKQLQSIGINGYSFDELSDVNLLQKTVSRNKQLHTFQISQSAINVNALVKILLTGTNIQHLLLERNNLNDDDMATLERAFRNLNHLRTLSLECNGISGTSVPILVNALAGAVNLHHLNLANNYQLTENWNKVTALSNLVQLKALYITGCKFEITHLPLLIETLPKLKLLELIEIGDFDLLDEDEEDLIKLYGAIYHLNLKHLKIVELVYRVN